MARLIFISNKTIIEKHIKLASESETPDAAAANKLIHSIEAVAAKSFQKAADKFESALNVCSKENASDEDAALKNTQFAALVFKVDSEAPTKAKA